MTLKVNKSALVERPLKTSAPTGAVLASLGIANSLPLMHGSQGCAAFAKVYLIQHFREPIPLQNTAIDQVAAVMGGDENLLQALELLCKKQAPELIAVLTTGLSEMQGCDVQRLIKEFQQQNPQWHSTAIVAMATPDFVGSMQTGFASAVDALVKTLVKPPKPRLYQRKQVNVLCSSSLTPADVELLKRYLEGFELDAIVVPDLSLSLDGHLASTELNSKSSGGTPVAAIERMSASVATLVFGNSLLATGQWLEHQYGIPVYSFGMAMGMDAGDQLVMCLASLSGRPVPAWIERARAQLQDALLDCHFLLSATPVAMALETDLAAGYVALLAEQGMVIKRVVSPTLYQEHEHSQAELHVVGDLSDLDEVMAEVDLIIGNTHVAHQCEPSIPVLRAGYPCHDRLGASDTLQLGYQGSRSCLFGLANLLKAHHHDEVPAHYSHYRFEPEAMPSYQAKEHSHDQR